MDCQLWKIYWAFRNGDYDHSTELLAVDANHQGKFDSAIKGPYGDTLLHLACQNGWLDFAKFLVEELGFDPEVKDCGHQTPLHYACHYGHLHIAQYLVRVHNCDVAVATRDHWTPLHYACRYGHLDIVEYIIDIPGVMSRKQLFSVTCKYSPNDYFLGLASLKDIKQGNPDSLSTLLQIACSFNQVPIVHYLCNKHSSHQYLNDEADTRRLFMLCCKRGLLEILLQLRLTVSHHVDAQGRSGLHYACQGDHISVAKHLVEECGCDINKMDRNGCNPLQLVCQYSHNINMVKYILSRLKCACAWNEALTLVFCKQQWSDSECIDLIKLLMSTKEWLPNSRCNLDGDTVLHLAAKHNRYNVAQFLLFDSKFQFDPNVRNIKGETPFKQASNTDILLYLIRQERVELDKEVVNRLLISTTQEQDPACIEIFRLIIKNWQWDPNSSCNPNGDTALHLSARYHRSIIAHFLLSESNCNPNTKNKDGATPLDLATDVKIISLLINSERVRSKPGNAITERMLNHSTDEQDSLCIDVLKALIDLGQWNPNLSHNSEGDTALHLAVRLHKPVLTLFLLLEVKCDPTIINLKGETPIQQIIEFCSDLECTDLIKQIIATKLWNPDSICNSEGDTTLHLSALHYRQTLTSFLVTNFKAGCLLNMKNEGGETPLYILLSTSQWTDSDCIQLIKTLITSKRWDPNSSCDSEDNTVLHLAALYYRPKVAEFMISKAICDPNIKNASGETPLEVLMPIWPDSECISIIKSLIITQKWDPNANCSSQNDTALHLAARCHRSMTARFLLSESNCNPNKKNGDGLTPLDLATSLGIISLLVWSERVQSKHGNSIVKKVLTYSTAEQDSICIDILEALIELGQWYPTLSSNSRGDMSALHLSIQLHRPVLAHFLLSEPNARNLKGKIPIQLIIQCISDPECTDLIKKVITMKLWDANSICNSEGNTALHLSAWYYRPNLANFLLFEAGGHINVKNEEGKTPLYLQLLVPKWKDSDCINLIQNLIMTKHWDPNSECDSEGNTVLHLTAINCRLRVAEFMLSETICDLNIKNIAGETPFQLFMREWSASECISIIKLLIATNRWDPNSSCNVENDTAIHLAARHHKCRVLDLLLSETKFDPVIQNGQGETLVVLLMSGVIWQDSECIKIIRGLMTTIQWDPNSSCNPEGDTALHLSARYHKPRILNFLLSEAKCDPNIMNIKGETLVELLISDTRWHDSECVDIIKALLATKQWDPNSSCNSQGDTALHLSARYHKHRVIMFLLSEDDCDPIVRNKKGETLVGLLILNTRKWYDLECVGIIKALLATKQWDPNSSCNSKDDTVLHLSARYREHGIVMFLFSEAKCDPNIRNNKGETLIELLISQWHDSECVDIIKALLAFKQWEPNSSCNSKGDTALHLSARYCKHRTLKFLLSETNYDPSIRNNKGETLIELLISDARWLDTECVDIVKVIMATKQWDPNSSCNSKGDTALHLLARYHHQRHRVLHYMLSEAKSDPNSKNLNDETPLHLANNADVINHLIRHGANPNNVYKLYGKTVRLRKPLKPPVKVFIVGNSGVGKSTLTEALKIEVSLLTRAFTAKRRVSDVDEKTAGIVPHDFESKSYGCVTLYDFAGHREFYSSHAAFLHNVIIQGSSSVFLVVVNMSAEKDIIRQNVLYWLSFIVNQCSAISCASHVIVIGSHADVVLDSGDDPQQKAMEISESVKKIFQSSNVKYANFYPLDCQYPESPGMTRLRYCLTEICNSVRIPKVIPFNAHCFLVFLLDKFRALVAVTVQDIKDQIMNEQNTKEGVARFLPNTSSTICKVCDELNNSGHIIVLKNTYNIENSWVIIDKAHLLSEVTGTIFAPRDFKEHCQLAESTGIVPLSRLTEHFPDLRTEVLVGFMTHLEFCREILDSELLELITKHHESLNDTYTFASAGSTEHYFLFPGLITQQAPDNLWKQNHVFKYHYGWILQCIRPDEFFSSRFLQVLLLRLAFSFALVKVEVNETIPAFQRECSIWKNGIFWGEIFGMEIIIEVHPSSKMVILQIRCRAEHLLHCISQRSHIIRKILECVHDFCPQIKTLESFIDPFEATKFPIKLAPQMPRFNVQTIAEAILQFSDHYPLSVVSARRIILLDDLVTFEPYAEIGSTMLKSLCSDANHFGNKLSDQVLKILSLKLSRKANIFVEMFKEPNLLSSTSIREELLTVLKQWRDGSEGTYKSLKEKLDQYSIFAGRNILELSRVPLQIQDDEDDKSDTNNDHSEMPTYAECAAMPSATANISKKPDPADKLLQELPEYDNSDEDRVSSLPTYESATRLHTIPTGLNSTADDLQEGDVDNKSLQILPGYDEIDEDKAAAVLSLPTYETASKLNTTSMKTSSNGYCHLDEGDNDARRKTLLGSSTCLCASATPELHQLDYLERNGKTVRVIDRAAAIWDKVALRLHFERHDIARIARDHHQQSDLAATKVFTEWLDGKGRQPSTWAMLIKALKETEHEFFTDVISDLDCILGINDASDKSQEVEVPILSSICTSASSQPQCNGSISFISDSIATKSTITDSAKATDDSKEEADIMLKRRSDLPQADHKPKLSELQLLKCRGDRKVKVIEGVGDRWKDLARSLDFDEPRIDTIDMGTPNEQPIEACQQMLTEWMDGDDDLRGPVTWATLIQCLIDAGLIDMAERLKEFINS